MTDRIFSQAAAEYRAANTDQSHTATEPACASSVRVTLLNGAGLVPQPVRWFWTGWLAKGKLHVLGGAPGTGKTMLALRIAATISTGGMWPDGSYCEAGNVVIWSGEDDPRDTLVPRLIASGANMSRVNFVGDVQESGKQRSFDIARDIEPLRGAIKEAGGAALLIVDPIVSAVSGDSHKNAEVRRGLAPLCDLAAAVDAALIGITHLTKGTAGRDPTERLTGSLAFGALARIVLIAAKKAVEEDGAPTPRVLMRSKSNIGPDDGGFTYTLEQLELPASPGVIASRIVFGEPIEGNARDVLGEAEATATGGDGRVLDDATVFLQALLAAGPLKVAEIHKNAEGAGVSLASLRRAKNALGIKPTRSGYGADGGWQWELPPQRCPKMLKDAQQKKLSTFDKNEHLCANDDVEVEI